MPEARSWARLGGWLGIAWPILFIVVMVAAEMTFPPSHSTAEELAALGQAHVGHFGMLLHSLAAMIGLLGIGWAVALNSVLQSERRSRAATLAATFAVAGFALAMAMLIVQGSVQTGIGEHTPNSLLTLTVPQRSPPSVQCDGLISASTSLGTSSSRGR